MIKGLLPSTALALIVKKTFGTYDYKLTVTRRWLFLTWTESYYVTETPFEWIFHHEPDMLEPSGRLLWDLESIMSVAIARLSMSQTSVIGR